MLYFQNRRGTVSYIKKIGITYSELEKMGFLLPLTETQCKYIYGLTYEDEVLITCQIEKLTVARIEFFYEVYKLPQMQKVSEGRTKHGIVDRDLKPINAKKMFPEIWERMTELL